MKILLVGEYSRFHNSLKEGLTKLGHEVTIAGNSDSFKKFPVDINIDSKIGNNSIINSLIHFIYAVTRIDISSIESYIRFLKNRKQFIGYDHVQLINETPFRITPYFQTKVLKFIFANNKSVFLSACGDDYVFISFLLSGQFPYSTLSPYIEDPGLKKQYKYTLNRVNKQHKKIHDLVFRFIKGVIPASVEYFIPYKDSNKVTEMIPNAINIDKIDYKQLDIQDKIIIFHGVNKGNYVKKGNKYFEEALKIIIQKYKDRIEVITTHNLPYDTYIKKFKKAHIILDQALAHDQGYNALEAMAMGKVVFTGAGDSFKNHYGLHHLVAINATPDSNKIVKNLEWLICNPNKIREIGENARTFIEQHHHYKKVAQKYIQTWEQYK